jgi:hypothetical protein
MRPPQALPVRASHQEVTLCQLVYGVMDIHVLFPALVDKFEVITL